jgi:ComF family protein
MRDPLLLAIWHDLAEAVFPSVCPVCRVGRGDGRTAPDDGLGCDEHRLPLGLPGPRCGRCATRISDALPDGERCAECRQRAPAFRSVVALADYRESPSVREWILALKYGRRADLAATLGRALGARVLARAEASACKDTEPRPLLVPVPLHFLRRFERGYDQALLLAREAAGVANMRVVRALSRTRFTSVQGALGASSRTANVHGAFRVRRFHARVVRDADVWLVDDVVTSGATADECARTLLRAGARSVRVLAVARAG